MEPPPKSGRFTGSNSWSSDQNALFRIGEDGSIDRIAEEVYGIAPSPAGPVAIFVETSAKKQKMVLGVFDSVTGALSPEGVLEGLKLTAIGPPELRSREDGLLAHWGPYGGGVTVLDMGNLTVVGQVDLPRKVTTVFRAFPASSGAWLQASTSGRAEPYFAPFEGKMIKVDGCAGLPKSCVSGVVGQSGDAVWLIAGPLESKYGGMDLSETVLRRYEDPGGSASLEIKVSDLAGPAGPVED